MRVAGAVAALKPGLKPVMTIGASSRIPLRSFPKDEHDVTMTDEEVSGETSDTVAGIAAPLE